ncbi:hypothetical protein HWB57_gp022 [Erwinia phage vB_EamM-Bue1]|uniref:Uncharacterized protein n=1 Tax=Erwinia phage vB_EamM-Bue1 TaxID=2099338 RepID=A0A2P1JU36_9CAUD|nr:hypothetical protein HWB57_gp022 [Erwinia phage vB_EamM-Bue1]AVO22865.1 hypothetical protein [Erwinia phage vB_EamM-Bue1]
MSWNDRQYLTELEALDQRELPVSQFAAGDRIIVSLAELDEDFDNGPLLPGVIVGVSFSASQVRYDVAYKIEGSSVYTVVTGVRAQMFRPSDGAETNFIGLEDAIELAKQIKPTLVVVDSNPAPAPQGLADIVRELEQTLIQCNRYNYCSHVMDKLKKALNLG